MPGEPIDITTQERDPDATNDVEVQRKAEALTDALDPRVRAEIATNTARADVVVNGIMARVNQVNVQAAQLAPGGARNPNESTDILIGIDRAVGRLTTDIATLRQQVQAIQQAGGDGYKTRFFLSACKWAVKTIATATATYYAIKVLGNLWSCIKSCPLGHCRKSCLPGGDRQAIFVEVRQ